MASYIPILAQRESPYKQLKHIKNNSETIFSLKWMSSLNDTIAKSWICPEFHLQDFPLQMDMREKQFPNIDLYTLYMSLFFKGIVQKQSPK